jgi:hypothetical protein
MDPTTHCVVFSRDVVFREEEFPPIYSIADASSMRELTGGGTALPHKPLTLYASTTELIYDESLDDSVENSLSEPKLSIKEASTLWSTWATSRLVPKTTHYVRFSIDDKVYYPIYDEDESRFSIINTTTNDDESRFPVITNPNDDEPRFTTIKPPSATVNLARNSVELLTPSHERIVAPDAEAPLRNSIGVEEQHHDKVEFRYDFTAEGDQALLPTSHSVGDVELNHPLAATDTQDKHISLCLNAAMAKPDIPASWKEAMKHPQATEWLLAGQAEYQSLVDNKTWELVDPPRDGHNILRTRWVFTKKLKADGSIDRFKARLVVQGFRQRPGVDYNEIFSPVVRMEVLRTLFGIAARLNYEIHQMDVKTAFLNGGIDAVVYIHQPEGFVDRLNPKAACLLRKSLYGLKQSPRIWYSTFVEFMTSLGFVRTRKDRCVFVKRYGNMLVYISLYVDDLLIFAPNTLIVNELKQAFMRRFQMTDCGEVSYILGWQITRNRAERTIFIHQNKYISEILRKFNLHSCNSKPTPLEVNIDLSMKSNHDFEIELLEKAMPYRSCVGSLMYLVIGTRPDLAHCVQQLSQYLNSPTTVHYHSLKRVFKYLSGTAYHGLTFGGVKEPKHILEAYVDADYANCKDTRRCISGYATYFYGSPISWLSKKQPTVSLSTTEAEYTALASCIQECLYLKFLLLDLGFDIQKPIQIHEDNQSCIKIARNPALHAHSKHIDVKYFFVKELTESQVFNIEYCNTTNQVADIFTKALPKPTFERLRCLLQVKSLQDYQSLTPTVARN